MARDAPDADSRVHPEGSDGTTAAAVPPPMTPMTSRFPAAYTGGGWMTTDVAAVELALYPIP